MARQILEIVDLSKINEVTVPEPVRFVFPSPERGGPGVSEIRRALAPKGRLRLSGTPAHVFADLDPGDPEPVILALETIVRSDAAGLTRMLLSALPYVDEIVLGVDERSDEATLHVAQAYADCVFTFDAADLNLSDEAWRSNKIDFSAARNLGRQRVHAPWTLVVDSDEYLQSSCDIRKAIALVPPEIGALAPLVVLHDDMGMKTFEQRDCQRLARTRYRWEQASHNQLRISDSIEPPKIATVIVSDPTLRARDEQARRYAQRHEGVNDLVEQAAQGNLNALFHLAKHRAGSGDLREAVALVEDFRLRVEPNSILKEQRQWLALAIGFKFYQEDKFDEANKWACRTLLDGPSIAAFCLLGDIAEDEGDLPRALQWYQAACAVQDDDRIGWPGLTEVRWGRLEGIRRALTPLDAPHADLAPSGSASAV